MNFSIGGSEYQLKQFVCHLLTKHKLSLERDFAAVFSDLIHYGRNLEGNIVVQSGFVSVGGQCEKHFHLPDDFYVAAAAIKSSL